MKRLALIAPAIVLLAACDTTKVTQTFGEVVIHTAPAPAVKPEIGTPVSFERNPVVHYDGCLELTVSNPACPQQALHFDPAPEIGEPMTIVNEWPRTVTPLPDSCQLVTRQDGDYLRARWENAAQQPCTPCVEHAQEVPETGCAKVVVP